MVESRECSCDSRLIRWKLPERLLDAPWHKQADCQLPFGRKEELVFHHDGRRPAEPAKSLFSVNIVQPGSSIEAAGAAATEQYAVMPGAADSPFRAMSFSTAMQEVRDGSPRPVKVTERRPLSPDAVFFRSLEGERATHRIERAIGIKGEGPAISFNSTSLRTLIGDNREKAIALLDRYYDIYSASFPDPDERLPFETILTLIEDPRFSIDVDIFTQQRGVIGGYQTHVAEIHGDFYSLGDYLCVDNRLKGMGIAPLVYRTTIQQRRDLFGTIAHFGEVNDPRLMDASQRMVDIKSGTDPDARLRFWTRQGRQMLDIPWIQPATAEGLSTVDYMMLTVHHIDHTKSLRLTGEIVQKVWDAYYLPLAEVAPVHETRKEMERLLAPYQGREISLLPLTSSRSFMGKAQG